MKRNQLEELGLEKDVIDKIMSINGEDIEKAKGNLDQVKEQLQGLQADITKRDADLKALQEQLTAAQTDAGKLADVQGQLTSLQTDYTAKQQEWEAKEKSWREETAKRDYSSAVKAEMGKLKFSSSAASRDFERGVIDAKLQLDGEKLIGFNDFVDKWKGENADAFAPETPPAPQPAQGGTYPLPPKGAGAQGGSTSSFGFHFNPIHPVNKD